MSRGMIHRTPFFLPYIYPKLTWRFPAAEKELYLTFDDGPVAGPTDFVLETLQQRNLKATFFCIGDNIRKHPAIFKRVADAGHTVVETLGGALDRTLASLDPYLMQLQLHQRARHA